MKVKFNKYERVAGLFVLVAVLGILFGTVGVAVEKGWFSSKVAFVTMVESAEGIHSGTLVQVAGLRAGEVSSVELLSAQEVRVEFEIFEKFHERIREDSVVQVVRPFIIGEKVLDVTVGGESSPKVAKRGTIPSMKGMDIMDLMSGRKLAPLLGTLEGLMENMRMLMDAFSDPERIRAVIRMFDRMDPMIKNLNKMAIEFVKVTDIATRDERLEKMVDNVTLLTTEFKKITPTINAVAPELPRASQRAVEALDEVVVTLKAMQKSWMMRGSVEEVREEEAQRRKAKRKRKPAETTESKLEPVGVN